MAIASEFEVWWSVEESLLHVYKTPIWKIGDLICCNNRMSSLRPDLDTKALSTLQRASLVEKSRQKPQERMKVLCEALKCNNYDSEPLLRSCGISISTSFTQVDGRVLPTPRVVDAPEILTIIEKISYLSEFLNSLYECQYKSFFVAFAGLTEQIKLNRYLHPHFRYYMREVRTVVYSQFLESYKSVTIEAIAKAFGVTVEFNDLELSHFIAAGKLHCKIDKVAGVLETNRPDAKNALYQATIKQGDFLLNWIQKLSRVIDL
ncbi:26S proteasome non-ATPase regulatory subunit 6 homolog isoform X2 [Castanea sativa]